MATNLLQRQQLKVINLKPKASAGEKKKHKRIIELAVMVIVASDEQGNEMLSIFTTQNEIKRGVQTRSTMQTTTRFMKVRQCNRQHQLFGANKSVALKVILDTKLWVICAHLQFRSTVTKSKTCVCRFGFCFGSA